MSDFGSAFSGALSATSGMFQRNRALDLQQQEIELRRPAAEAQQLENDQNRQFYEYLQRVRDAEMARRGAGGRAGPALGAASAPPASSAPATGPIGSILNPAPSTPPTPGSQPLGTPQQGAESPLPGAGDSLPGANRPQAPAQGAPAAQPPAQGATPPAQGGAQGAQANPLATAQGIRQLASEAPAALRTAAQIAGVAPDQMTAEGWRSFLSAAELHLGAPAAQRMMTALQQRQAAVLAQSSAQALAAVGAGDFQGAARILNAANAYSIDGNRNVFQPSASGMQLTRTPENGQGQPQTIPLSADQMTAYLHTAMDPQWWLTHVLRRETLAETRRAHQASEGIASRGVAIRERAEQRELADERRDQAGVAAFARLRENPDNPEAQSAYYTALSGMSVNGLRRLEALQQSGERLRLAQGEAQAREQSRALRDQLARAEEERRNATGREQIRQADERLIELRRRNAALEAGRQELRPMTPEQHDSFRRTVDGAGLDFNLPNPTGRGGNDLRPTVDAQGPLYYSVNNGQVDPVTVARGIMEIARLADTPDALWARISGDRFRTSSGVDMRIPATQLRELIDARQPSVSGSPAGQAQGTAPQAPGLWNRVFGGGGSSGAPAAPVAPTDTGAPPAPAAPPSAGINPRPGGGNPRGAGLQRPPATSTWNPVPPEGSASRRNLDEMMRARGINPSQIPGR